MLDICRYDHPISVIRPDNRLMPARMRAFINALAGDS
jgi:hypothetical protein